jgi:hypothetical protein
MGHHHRYSIRLGPPGILKAISLTIAVLLSVATLSADTLSSNLEEVSAGFETAAGDTSLAISFAPDASAYVLNSATLLLSGTGTAQLSLYSDATLGPASLLGIFASTGSTSSTLSPSAFVSDSISLASNTTYWLVLQALTGSVNWSWSKTDAGTGGGYTNTWAITNDGGSTWFSFNAYSLQASVDATADAAATPEPVTVLMLGLGLIGLSIAGGIHPFRSKA